MRKMKKPRNQVARELINFRPKIEPTVEEKEKKRDEWNRNSKHKGKKNEFKE